MKTCKKTGKRIFWSQGGALMDASRCARKRGDTLRVYRCEFCHQWHLTSQPEKL